jgi:hypothetical protein
MQSGLRTPFREKLSGLRCEMALDNTDKFMINVIQTFGLFSESEAEKLLPFIHAAIEGGKESAVDFAIEASKQGFSVLDIIEFFKDGSWEGSLISHD